MREIKMGERASHTLSNDRARPILENTLHYSIEWTKAVGALGLVGIVTLLPPPAFASGT